jgi:hypothetical protein
MKQALVWAMEAARSLNDRGRMEDLAASVGAIPPGLRSPVVDACGHLMRGWLATDAGVADRARQAAEGRFRECEIPFWLGVTLLERAQAGPTDGRQPDALLAEARGIFEHLGATPWVDRVAAAEAAVSVG